MAKSVLLVIDKLFAEATYKPLSTLQKQIIEGLLSDNTYREIADKLGYDEGYVGDKARELFKALSKVTGELVNKSNFSWVIERFTESKVNLKEINGSLVNSKGEINQVKIIESDGIIDILLIGGKENV